jgi:diaminohydroxyphosphoribosylaminopyrimidine deaminase / 5-amino-6-(5-phosphoribosylamino)uracil reductase
MSAPDPETWRRLLRRRPADQTACPLYGPLLAAATAADGCFVLGRIAQSLDGRIATARGESHWISGREDVVHTHRLRALFDAVVVGAGTIRADDPQLTTRDVEGRSPVRVVIDTHRRLHGDYRVFRDGPPTILCCAQDAPGYDRLGAAKVVRLPRSGTGIAVPSLLEALASHGLRRVYVEGGGITVSRFLAAGALDRLHVTIAPLLLGSGIPAFTLAEGTDLAAALRFGWSVHRLGPDLLVDIALHRACPRRAAP